jgi:hypothetical protein
VTYQVVTPTAYVVSSSSNNDSPCSDVISQSIGNVSQPIAHHANSDSMNETVVRDGDDVITFLDVPELINYSLPREFTTGSEGYFAVSIHHDVKSTEEVIFKDFALLFHCPCSWNPFFSFPVGTPMISPLTMDIDAGDAERDLLLYSARKIRFQTKHAPYVHTTVLNTKRAYVFAHLDTPVSVWLLSDHDTSVIYRFSTSVTSAPTEVYTRRTQPCKSFELQSHAACTFGYDEPGAADSSNILYAKLHKRRVILTSHRFREAIAVRLMTDQNTLTQIALCYLDVPVKDVSHTYGDNESVVNSSSVPHAKLHKRHVMLSFHRVREAIVFKLMTFNFIPGDNNPADILSKAWGYTQVWPTLKPVLFWEGDTMDC